MMNWGFFASFLHISSLSLLALVGLYRQAGNVTVLTSWHSIATDAERFALNVNNSAFFLSIVVLKKYFP